MARLSDKQHSIYQKLQEYYRHNGRTPELAAFARNLGMHYVSLKQHLEALHNKGFLTFESRGRGRSPHLELPIDATGVPVLGSIPAGPLSEAIPLAEGYLPFPGFHERHFALRVHGDSMADLIQDGDVVLFEKRSPQRSGEICAVRVDGSEVTLKYLDRLADDRYALRPHNPHFPTMALSAQGLTIEGVYQGLLRGEVLRALLLEPD